MEPKQIREIVDFAIQQFLDHDRYLLEADANELAMTGALSRYIAEQLPDWVVDCEYNRDRGTTKRLRLERGRHEFYRVPKSVRVIPDIIVHLRGTGDNLLVVESKKSSNEEPEDFDLHKLQEYARQLDYRYALFLKFIVGDAPGIQSKWIRG